MEPKKSSPIKKDILVRVRLLYAGFVLMGAAIMGKIFYTQYGPGSSQLRAEADNIIYEQVRLPASRGDILARKKEILATHIPVFEVYMDFYAPIVDTTMKETVKRRIWAQARREGKDKDRRAKKRIMEQARERTRDHPYLNEQAAQLRERQCDTLALTLSAMFGDYSAAEYSRRLKNFFDTRGPRKHRYVRITPHKIGAPELKVLMAAPLLNIKRIDPKTGEQILWVPKRGCTEIREELRRDHPYGSLAENTLGFLPKEDSVVKVMRDGTRQKVKSDTTGIEKAFDRYLRGKDGSMMIQTISGLNKLPVRDPQSSDPVHGIDVVTTIDLELQDVAERELRKQLDLQQADWGCVVLMEVATGEIRVMSNLTRNKQTGRINDDFNYAVGYNMEPGSTFKLMTMMTLMDDAKLTLDTQVDTRNSPGLNYRRVGRAVVRDDHHPEGVIPLSRVFATSSNIGFSQLTHDHYASDPQRFVDYVCKIGLDKPLGIQIDGSVKPEIRHPGGWGWSTGETLEKMAYGYNLRVTPMRTLCLYNAVANDGKMISPLLVKELRQYGQTVRTFSSQTIVDKVCSPSTLSAIRESLGRVVDEGTGRVLRSPYYKVAAKTGTAQEAFDRYGYVDQHGGRKYVATMVGYFPADKPRYTCIVVMHTYFGQGNYHTYYGASLAGPVFKAVADRVYAMHTDWHPRLRDSTRIADPLIPVKGGRVKDLQKVASRLDIRLPVEKDDQWAIPFIHKPGRDAPADSLAAAAGLFRVEGVAVVPGRVPKVVGMGLKEALYLLEGAGLKVAFTGRGKVVSQSIAPGSAAVRGQVVHISLGT